jgi:hypothetical protein
LWSLDVWRKLLIFWKQKIIKEGFGSGTALMFSGWITRTEALLYYLAKFLLLKFYLLIPKIHAINSWLFACMLSSLSVKCGAECTTHWSNIN